MDSKYKSAQARMNIQDDFIEFNETNINTLRADVQDVGIPTTDPDTGMKSTQPTSTNFRAETSKLAPTAQPNPAPTSETKTPSKPNLFDQSTSPIEVANTTPTARDLNNILVNDPPPSSKKTTPTDHPQTTWRGHQIQVPPSSA